MRKIKRYNTFTKKEYFHLLENLKKFKDFNGLGFFRSILVNNKLNIEEKIEVRDFAIEKIGKQFEFLQIKDNKTYFSLLTLGEKLNCSQEAKIWKEILKNQEIILKNKRIKHRNFGTYSKHLCGQDFCHLNETMVKQGQDSYVREMRFSNDKNKYEIKEKAIRNKKSRKNEKKDIRNLLDEF